MKKLKKIVVANWALIGLLATAYVDHSLELLANSGLSEASIKFIHLSGLIVVGYFWNPKPIEKTV